MYTHRFVNFTFLYSETIMVYATFESFCVCEVSSALIKQKLLWEIDVSRTAKHPTFDVEYNVYQLIIRYEEHHVELWDTLIYDDQEPCIMTLESFLAALKAHVPPR